MVFGFLKKYFLIYFVKFQLEQLKWNLSWDFWNKKHVDFSKINCVGNSIKRIVVDDEWKIVNDEHGLSNMLMNCNWIKEAKNNHETNRSSFIDFSNDYMSRMSENEKYFNSLNESLGNAQDDNVFDLKINNCLLIETISFPHCNYFVNDSTMFHIICWVDLNKSMHNILF